MSGWIKIHREITDHWIFQDAEKFKWWIDLLMMASHEDVKKIIGNQLTELKRGQLIASNSFLSERWKTSESSVRRYLGLLVLDNMVVRCTNRKITIITICNYERYQVNESKERTDERSDDEPMMNRWRSEYKNVEEDKEIYKSSTAPAHTCESEYVRKYREEGMWMDTALILHKTPQECESLFDRWVVEYQHNGDTHSSYSDFKKHFVQWARIMISKESRNGNNRPDNSRRGRAVVPTDISLDF